MMNWRKRRNSEKKNITHVWFCPPNPADSLTPIGLYEGCKIFLATITLVAPIRFACMWGLLLMGWGIARLVTVGLPSPTPPLTGWRKLLVFPLRLGARLIMYLAGFLWVHVSGSADPRAPILVATHTSIWDSIWFIFYLGACQGAKHELFDQPVLGDYLRAFSSLPIDRHSRDGRRRALTEIQNRAQHANYPPLLLFPTACCSNSRQLVHFKRGAFDAHVPVQPVGIAYLARHADLKLTSNVLWDMYRTACQFSNHMAVTFLPIRYPSEGPAWASDVREEMGLKLGCQLVDHRFEQDQLRIRARPVRVNELKLPVDLDFHLAFKIIDRFKMVDLDRDGWVGLRDIGNFFPEIDVSPSEYQQLLALAKLPPIPVSNYFNPMASPNYDSWTEEGWVGRVTGGRPPLRPRQPDPYEWDKFELVEVLAYFNSHPSPHPFLQQLFCP